VEEPAIRNPLCADQSLLKGENRRAQVPAAETNAGGQSTYQVPVYQTIGPPSSQFSEFFVGLLGQRAHPASTDAGDVLEISRPHLPLTAAPPRRMRDFGA
jgi:hypothetical protein